MADTASAASCTHHERAVGAYVGCCQHGWTESSCRGKTLAHNIHYTEREFIGSFGLPKAQIIVNNAVQVVGTVLAWHVLRNFTRCVLTSLMMTAIK